MFNLEDGPEKQILVDSLCEFISARSPINSYVADRYSGQTSKFRNDKTIEVANRIFTAKDMLRRLGRG